MEPSSLSEQEQIALAISNSLRAFSNDDDNHDDDSLDNVDEDSDYEDFDDESSSQSFAKGPSSQATSEHSNSNIGASKSEIVECDTNNIGSTTDIADSYENYLGDESGLYIHITLLYYILYFVRRLRAPPAHTHLIIHINSLICEQIQRREYSCDCPMVIGI